MCWLLTAARSSERNVREMNPCLLWSQLPAGLGGYQALLPRLLAAGAVLPSWTQTSSWAFLSACRWLGIIKGHLWMAVEIKIIELVKFQLQLLRSWNRLHLFVFSAGEKERKTWGCPSKLVTSWAPCAQQTQGQPVLLLWRMWFKAFTQCSDSGCFQMRPIEMLWQMGALFKSGAVKLLQSFCWGEKLWELTGEGKSEFKRIAVTNPFGLAVGSLTSSDISVQS